MNKYKGNIKKNFAYCIVLFFVKNVFKLTIFNNFYLFPYVPKLTRKLFSHPYALKPN